MNQIEAMQIVAQLGFKDRVFNIEPVPGYLEGFFLKMAYWEPDIATGRPELQQTRKWHIPADATESQIVQTALKCVLTSQEHVAREHFTYQGERIFQPHQDVADLLDLARTRTIREEIRR